MKTQMWIKQGAGGYNTNLWRESNVIQHLQDQLLQGHAIYSNAPDRSIHLGESWRKDDSGENMARKFLSDKR
jgi:hypothetical protein